MRQRWRRESTTVPFRTLAPRRVRNLLFAGRLRFRRRPAYASPGMPQCMAMGQAAGVGAAVATPAPVRVQEVDAPSAWSTAGVAGGPRHRRAPAPRRVACEPRIHRASSSTGPAWRGGPAHGLPERTDVRSRARQTTVSSFWPFRPIACFAAGGMLEMCPIGLGRRPAPAPGRPPRRHAGREPSHIPGDTNAVETASNGWGGEGRLANTYPPNPEYQKHSRITDIAEFEAMWKRSVEDPDGFWGEMAGDLVTWSKKWDKVASGTSTCPYHRWFQGAKLNVCWNCSTGTSRPARATSRHHLRGRPGRRPRRGPTSELLDEVCRFANVLKKHGVKKGDRVAIYLPMIAELPIVMLACARIGAIHMVVFGGFSAEALKARIDNCGAKLLVTVDKGWRGGKTHRRQGQRRRRPPGRDDGREGHRRQAHRRRRRHAGRPRRLVPRRDGRRGRAGPHASAPRWTPRTRCSSSTRPAPPARPRASCTPTAATSPTWPPP